MIITIKCVKKLNKLLLNKERKKESPMILHACTEQRKNFENIAKDQEMPEFLKTLLKQAGLEKGQEGGKVLGVIEPTADNPFGCLIFECGDNIYHCTYIEDECVVISLPTACTYSPVGPYPTYSPAR